MTATDITLAGGLQQRTAEFLVPPGALLTAQNCRQNHNGALSKRPGNTQLTNQVQLDAYGGATTVSVTLGGALSTYGNQLLLTTNRGTAMYSPEYGTFGPYRPGSEALLTRTNIPTPPAITTANSTSLYVMPPSAVTDGTRIFYCWIDASSKLIVAVQNIATGALVQTHVTPPGITNPIWAVPVYVNSQFVVVSLDISGNLRMSTLPSPFTGAFAAAVTLLTSVSTSCNIDAVANGVNVTIAVGGSASQLTTWTTAGVSVATGAPIAGTTAIDVRLVIGFGVLWFSRLISGGSTIRVASYNTSTLALTMTGEYSFVGSGSFTTQAITPYTTNQIVLAFTQNISGPTQPSNTAAAVIDSTLAGGAGGEVVSATLNPLWGTMLASKPFMQNGKTYCWVSAFTDSLGSTPTAAEWGISNPELYTNILVDLRLDTATAGSFIPSRPVAVDSPRFTLPYSLTGSGQSLGASHAPMSVLQLSTNQWGFIAGVRQSQYVSTYALVTADFAAAPRWKSEQLGTLLLQSSGMVMNWDGERSFEQGFLTHIIKPFAAAISSGTGLTSGGAYYYRFIPYAADAAGNIHQGIPSPLYLAPTPSSTNLQMTISLYGGWPTDRGFINGTSSSARYPVYWAIYRSVNTPGSIGTDVVTYFVDLLSNEQVAGIQHYVDSASDVNIQNNAQCYTFGGAEPNVCPPGAWDIVAHQGRAWIIADDRSNLYFSKQLVDGEAVNFTDSNTIPMDVPNLRALASLDDKLIIFSDQNIYSLTGLGPADNGTQDDYGVPQSVMTDCGCTDRRSVVKTPDGIFFQSGLGIYFLDRGLQVTYIGQPVDDELAKYPVITSAVLHPSQPWVYFSVTNAAGTAGERLVYDYRVQQWYTDTLPAPCISMARTVSTLYWLDNTGQVWTEDTTGAVFTDAGNWVTMTFETSWNNTDSTKMNFANLDKFQVLAKKLSPCDVVLSMRENYMPKYDQSVIYFDNTQQSQPKLPTVEIEFASTPGPQESFTIIYQDFAPTGGASTTGQGWEVSAISFQSSEIDQPGDGKLNRLTPPARGKHLI